MNETLDEPSLKALALPAESLDITEQKEAVLVVLCPIPNPQNLRA